MQTGFLFDVNRCTGCGACAVACLVENGLTEASGWRTVLTFNASHHPGVATFHLSLACNHCADPPCAEGCPALAYERDLRTGALILRQDRCIGCRYCSWACPFDAPRYRAEKGVVSKCTWCSHRLADGMRPACVTSCPTDALRFGPLGSMPLREIPGFQESGCGPSISFRPLRNGLSGPECSAGINPPIVEPAAPSGGRGLSLAVEWPLAVFTVVAAILAALAAAWLPGRGWEDRALLFSGSVTAMAFSALHLGRKARAGRALLNLRRSWLSREIALFSAFSAALALPLIPALRHPAWDWLAAATGFLCLWAIDHVYDVLPPKVPAMFHSAGSLLTGMFLAACIAGLPLAAGLAGAVKLGLYAGRHRREPLFRSGKVVILRFAARIGLPIAAAGLYLGGLIGGLAAFGLLVAGEAIDRTEYYSGLELRSPSGLMEHELRRALDGSGSRAGAAID